MSTAITVRLLCLLAVVISSCWAPDANANASKSIREWVSCNGTSDDSLGVARAFKAARNNEFTLVVDCPVRLHIGSDYTRSVFIDNGTTVEFSGTGKFTVDNVFLPAFVIANSSNITLTNWNVEYDASLPVNWHMGGFVRNGEVIASPGIAPPTFAFNNLAITPWLAANRNVKFEVGVFSAFVGATNTSAVFFIAGDSSNLNVSGMTLHVPPAAGGNRFIPMAFSFSADYLDNQTVTHNTPMTSRYVGIPHDLTFSNIDLDGIYMGWQGNVQDATFEHIRSHRYGDLQDANGQNVGGIGKWFAPPHLFYLNYATNGDPALFNQRIYITDVIDAGPRVGVARDRPGEPQSGFALSLKIGCNDCSVTDYVSNRLDGFLDIMGSTNLTISNATATFDSSFVNNMYQALGFPAYGYKNITLEDVTMTDTAASSVQLPIANATSATNENLVFRNVRVVMNRWSGPGLPFPSIWGQGTVASFDYSMLKTAERMVRADKNDLQLTLQESPSTVKVGGSSRVTWSSREATSCSSHGLSGAGLRAGSEMVRAGGTASENFSYYCQNSGAASTVELPLAVVQ